MPRVSKKIQKLKKAKRNKDKKKRRLNGFTLFCRENQLSISQEIGTTSLSISRKDKTKLVNTEKTKRWKSQTEAEQAAFKKRAREINQENQLSSDSEEEDILQPEIVSSIPFTRKRKRTQQVMDREIGNLTTVGLAQGVQHVARVEELRRENCSHAEHPSGPNVNANTSVFISSAGFRERPPSQAEADHEIGWTRGRLSCKKSCK